MATYNYLTSTGVIIPDVSEIKSDVEGEYKSIFGDDFVVDPSTQQGALVTAEVTSRISIARNNAKLANQINPNIAGGIFFDSIWSLTDGERSPATRSTVQLTCSGVSFTTIPIGSVAKDTNGQSWISTNEAEIPLSGYVVISFESENTGAISASIGDVNQIADNSVLGWETVTNLSPAVEGVATQSDALARTARNASLALQGNQTSLAVISNVSTLSGVRSLSFRENEQSVDRVIDGVSLVKNSIWVCVDGGTDSDILKAIFKAKSGGSNWNGSVSGQVIDEYSGQPFVVKFDRPTYRGIKIKITVLNSGGSSSSTQIIDSVINYSTGGSQIGNGFAVGVDASPFEIAAAINSDYPNAFVTKIEMAFDISSPVYSQSTLNININEVATISRANIEVLII